MSLPTNRNEATRGHGQMSCNPEAHDYLAFAEVDPDQDSGLVSGVGSSVTADLRSLPAEELRRQYFACTRNLTHAQRLQVESDESLGDDANSPKLVCARALYQAWQSKTPPMFRTRRHINSR